MAESTPKVAKYAIFEITPALMNLVISFNLSRVEELHESTDMMVADRHLEPTDVRPQLRVLVGSGLRWPSPVRRRQDEGAQVGTLR